MYPANRNSGCSGFEVANTAMNSTAAIASFPASPIQPARNRLFALLPARGDIIVFDPPPSTLLTAHFGDEPKPFTKKVIGVAGDRVTRKKRTYFVNGRAVATAKPVSMRGEPLELGPTGLIPHGCYFVGTEHKDGFDSRYAAIGWICRPRVLGVGRPIL